MSPARVRKVPMRQCAVCGAARAKRELLRVVRSPEGVVTVDDGGRAAGRGVYVCASADCLTQGARGRRLGQRLEADIPVAVRDELLRRAQAAV